MKGKKFYFLLISLIVVGIGSIYFYRQQEEQRILEFEGYEISTIEDQVQALYNEEKTDISSNISKETLDDLELIFKELEEKKLSRRSREQIQNLELDFLIAQSMVETEKEVEAIFVEEEVIEQGVSEEDIDALETEVLVFENMPVYIDRNIEFLAYARQQVIIIQQATEFIESLFDEEDNVLESTTREDEEEALERLEDIRNEEIIEELMARIEQVGLALTEREEQLAIEEELRLQEEAEMQEAEEIEEVEEAEQPEYTAPPAQTWTPPSSTPTPPAQENTPPVVDEPEGTDETEESEEPEETPEDTPEDSTEDEGDTTAPESDENSEETETENPTWESQY